METINDRIRLVVKESGRTKTDFAAQIDLSQSMISKLCSGAATPSDRTISDICKEFGVNEVWLRTGEGKCKQEETRQEQIIKFANQTVKGSDEFRKAFVAMLAKMDSDDWEALANIFRKLSEELTEKSE